MANITLETPIAAPVEVCFDLARDVDVHMTSMTKSGERAVAGVTHGMMDLDDTVTWKAKHFGVPWRLTSQITALARPDSFVDEMLHGAFRRWHHEHRFEARGVLTIMVDDVDFRSPLGPLGWCVDRLFLTRYMRKLLEKRNAYLKGEAEAMVAG